MLSVTLAVLVWRKLIDPELAQELSDRLGKNVVENMTIMEMVEEITETAKNIKKDK